MDGVNCSLNILCLRKFTSLAFKLEDGTRLKIVYDLTQGTSVTEGCSAWKFVIGFPFSELTAGRQIVVVRPLVRWSTVPTRLLTPVSLSET